MSKIFFLTVSLIAFNCAVISADDAFLPNHSRWKMIFSDEFNGNKINTDKWYVYNSKMRRKYMIGRFAENIKVEHGVLKLVTRQPDSKDLKFTAGFIRSKTFTRKYGYFAARMRYANASGLNNAFWLVTQNLPPEKSFEIDINEGHYPDEIVSTLHTWDNHKRQKSISAKYYPPKSNLAKEFHVYSVEWTPAKIITYFDGKKVFEAANEKCHSPAYVLLSTAVTLFSGKVSSALNGTSMDVDWVKVYEPVRSAPVIPDKCLKFDDNILSWHAAKDDVTSQSKLKYVIYGSRKDDISSYGDARKNGFKIYQVTGRTMVDLNCMPEGKYFFNVFAIDDAGNSSAYKSICAVNKVSVDKGIKLTVESRSWDKLKVSWRLANGKFASKYYIFLSDSPNVKNLQEAFENGKLTAVTRKNIYLLKGLKSTTDYFINVFALSQKGKIISSGMMKQRTSANFTPPLVKYDFTDPANPGIDSSGNNYNAKAFNVSIVNDPVKYDNVAVFNGKNSYMSLPELNLNSNQVTIVVRLFLAGKQNSYAGIVFSRRETAGLWIACDQEACGYRWPGGCPFDWKTAFKLPLNEWFMLVLVISPDSAKVYMKKDKKLHVSTYKATHLPIKLNYLEIGRDSFKHPQSGQTRYLRGRLDDVKIYNRVLTKEEIETLK
jgi:beta-glucanase (GH16 family)